MACSGSDSGENRRESENCIDKEKRVNCVYVKIIVIGAGAAGLTAGHLLEQRGIEFEILEAAPIYGGRVRKLEGFADFPIDLGAEWIHRWISAKPIAFTALLNGSDIQFGTVQDKPQTVSTWNGKQLRRRNWIRFLPLPIDLKFTDATWFDAIERLVTPNLIERLHLNTAVAAVEYTSEMVVVTTDSGEQHVADRVLVTIPITMLQREAIRFEPPLPDYKQAEIHKEQMPGGLKVFIKFSKRFYPDLLMMGSPLRGGALNECIYYNAAFGKNSTCNVLGFFAQGAKAGRYTSHSTDKDLFDFVRAELDEIFDGQASKYYIDHAIQDWTREPNIWGSYSQGKASGKTLAEPVGGKVFFAGEAMNANGKTIAVHGACESAYSAVEKMLAQPSGDCLHP